MSGWRWPRYIGEALLVFAPIVVSIAFVTLDAFGVAQMADRRLGWRELGLISFAVATVVMVVDLGRLTRRVVQLEDKRAAFDLVYMERHPYYWPAWGYRIGIYSRGPAALDGIEVMLKTIAPEVSMDLNVLPSALTHKDGLCHGNKCVINRGTEHYFDFLTNMIFKDDVSTLGQSWRLNTKHPAVVILDDQQKHIFEFVVSGHNASSETVYLSVLQTPGQPGGPPAHLEIERLEA